MSGIQPCFDYFIHSCHSWHVNSLLLLFVNEHSKKAQPREQQEGSRLHQSANKRLISAVHIRWVRPLTNCLTYCGGSRRHHIYVFLLRLLESTNINTCTRNRLWMGVLLQAIQNAWARDDSVLHTDTRTHAHVHTHIHTHTCPWLTVNVRAAWMELRWNVHSGLMICPLLTQLSLFSGTIISHYSKLDYLSQITRSCLFFVFFYCYSKWHEWDNVGTASLSSCCSPSGQWVVSFLFTRHALFIIDCRQ